MDTTEKITVTAGTDPQGTMGHIDLGNVYDVRYTNTDTIDLSQLSLKTPGYNYTFDTTTLGTGISSPQWTTGALGASQVTWPTITAITNPTAPTIMAQGNLALHGDHADIEINGKSLRDWMTQIEQRLNILQPNVQLESEWDELRALGERYRQLEKQCQEKSQMWNKLKSMPAPLDK